MCEARPAFARIDAAIEAVTRRAWSCKRAFFYRFPDKAALFGAVVRRIVEERRSPAGTPLYPAGSLQEVLRRSARLV